jgi:hypothetical protein
LFEFIVLVKLFFQQQQLKLSIKLFQQLLQQF